MKRMLLALFSALCFSSTAQITITASSFPIAGDTFKIAYDLAPGDIQVATPPGGDQIWNFSSLEITESDEVVYQPAGAGVNSMSFPGAELAVIGQSGETFFNITSTQMQALGYAGSDPANFGSYSLP